MKGFWLTQKKSRKERQRNMEQVNYKKTGTKLEDVNTNKAVIILNINE